ncbi:ral guanine nucleotide dissociation stimulator-like 1 isoform X1 [Drosophila albomicans]|uniref:Ral guanine nucleotide dissociation stimulator-like 1 isoform X1 n=1 Tax=Drosophila albomicans TaxID=7291 RepID=A0A6P8XB60_DROAB|nr:ral guanine nucleotide dissociation stimulator-like 1 isoform X1 [Drosophila albomicans]
MNFTSQANCNCQHSHHHHHHQQHQQQQHQQQKQHPTLIKSHTCAYQLQDLAGYNRALMPPLDNTDFSSTWRHVNNNKTTTPCAYHQQQQQLQQSPHWAKAKPKLQYHHHTCPRQKKSSIVTPTTTPCSTPTSTLGRQQKQKQQQRRSRSTSATATAGNKQRRNSSYHSYDDLDATSAVINAERKVVASLKYLCACTGATLRNLSKKTKDLHAKNYTYTKPTWRLWGEEHEKNAIFTVYLKKVRYHRPTPTASNQDSDDEISHLEWETVRVRFVKAATLARLVEALATDDGELESTFINVFLSTYRTFSTPKQVLSLLTQRYDALHEKHAEELELAQQNGTSEDQSYDSPASIHEQHKKTLVSALHVWLDGFPEDWHEDNLQQILAFAGKRLKRSDLHIKVLNRLERLLRQQVYGGGGGGGGATNNVESTPLPWLAAQAGQQFMMHTPCGSTYDLSEQFSGMYLAPIYRGPTHFMQAFRFPHVPVRHFAEQLTRMDTELFKRLIPHQCLGHTWARRDSGGSETVVATINQFNAVLFRVVSSILIDRLKPQDRALNISRWIDIAQELRMLKNFSSLKAIISALNSNSIYRLSKVWEFLPKERMEIFTELARICSEDNNAWTLREVLKREGTAKNPDPAGDQTDRHLQKLIQNLGTQTSHGTIPYLGTFLTDLTMIHTANPDYLTEDKLINFDKKRKEFEVLAQIKLLQGAANTYNLHEDALFDHWFGSMPLLDERQAFALSCQLEPPPPAPRKSVASTNTSLTNTTASSTASIMGSAGGHGHRKTDSIHSNSSSGAGSQFYCELNSSNSSRHNSLDRDAHHASLMSASSSTSNLSMDSSNSGGRQSAHSKLTHSQSLGNGLKNAALSNGTSNGGSPHTHINAQLVQPVGVTTQSAPDFYIIRVTYETDNIELDGIVLYKSIMLGNNERTPQVIRNAMLKLGLEDDPDRYTLAQVLPDKELVMPKTANVYYAVNTNYNLNFILRPRKDDAGGVGGAS